MKNKKYNYLIVYQARNWDNELVYGNMTLESKNELRPNDLDEVKDEIVETSPNKIHEGDILILNIIPLGGD